MENKHYTEGRKEQPRLSRVRRYLLTGLALIFPLFITFYLIYLLFHFAEKLAGQHVNAYLAGTYGIIIPGLGFFLLFGIVLGVGFAYHHFFGQKLLPVFERLFLKIPLVAHIYPSAKELSDFLFSEEKRKRFKKVVLVPYPKEGSYTLGLITNEHLREFNEASGSDLVSVLVPLAPAPFSGLIILVPRGRVKPTDISIERAVRFIVSGGVVLKGRAGEEPPP